MAGVRALCHAISAEKRAGCVSYPGVIQQIGAPVSAVPIVMHRVQTSYLSLAK